MLVNVICLTFHNTCKSKNTDLRKSDFYNYSAPTNDDKQLGNIMTCKVILSIMLQFKIWHRINNTDNQPSHWLNLARFRHYFGLG